MLESIKFRGSVGLLKVHPLVLSDNEQVKSELDSIKGNIVDMKDRVIIEIIPCDFSIIDTGFVLFGPFGSIYGNFSKGVSYTWGEYLILSTGKSVYRLKIKDTDKERLKGVLSSIKTSWGKVVF